MKRTLVALLLAIACLLAAGGCPQQPRTLPPIEIYFSPKGGATEAVVEELNRAQKKVLMQAYSFTSKPIAKALIEAQKRGVVVQAILDKSHRTEQYSEADFLLHSGVSVLIDAKHAIAHNKIMILDDQVVITGSFNFTNQAENSNAENLLVIRDQELARQYTANWQRHADHSEPYQGRETVAGGASAETGESTPAQTPSTSASSEGYVSSASAQYFHKSGCKSVAKIAEKNRIHYPVRILAVLAGKKPCPECNP